MNIQSERHSLVIVNVHFEPELTLRQLRPAYLHGVGVTVGDFNICDPEEGRFNVWNHTVTDGDPGKTAVFHSSFPHIFEVAQSDYTRRDAAALGDIRTLSRIDRIFINLPMCEARDFHCSSHVDDHAAVRLVILKPTHRRDQNKRIPSWMSEHPVFSVLSCSSFMTITDSLLNYQGKTPDCIGHSCCFACLSKSTSWEMV